MGILNDIQEHQKKSNTKKIIGLIIVLFGVGYFTYLYFFQVRENVNTVEKKVFTPIIGDLKTSISGDGKVLYKEDYNLNFPISGTVKNIYKKEGDIVKSGDVIASLDTTYFELELQKAEILLKKAQDDLNLKKNQYSPTDIKISEQQLYSTKVSLDNIKISGEIDIENAKSALKTAEISLSSALNDLDISKSNLDLIKIQEQEKYDNKLEDIINVIGSNVSVNKEILLNIDLLLGVTLENKDKNDLFDDYLGAKNIGVKNEAITNFKDANNKFNEFIIDWKNYRLGDKNLLLSFEYLNRAEEISKLVNKSLGSTLETVKASISSLGNLSDSQINSYIDEFENDILKIKGEIHSLVESRQIALEQKTSLDTKILTMQNDIKILESKYLLALQKLDEAKTNLLNSMKKLDNNLMLAQNQVNISETTLLGKTSGATFSELAPFYTNIDNAKKTLEEARKKLSDATLVSPIDGKIVNINGNIGSFVGGDKDISFVTITNVSNFYIESYIEELDISRIQDNTKVYLTFDALDGTKLEGNVYYISDKSTTDNNGVVTYKVEIQFNPDDSKIREGMTTYVEFITQEVKNVLIIPVGSVKPINGKASVQLENGEWIPVVTGFTDGNMLEIISGLNVKEKIIY